MKFSIDANKMQISIANVIAPENLITDHFKIETKLWKQTLELSSVFIGKLSSQKW
jgi:hypothetical protein